MTLNDFIDEQLQDPEFKKEWEKSENSYQKLLTEIECEDKSELVSSYRMDRTRSAVGSL